MQSIRTTLFAVLLAAGTLTTACENPGCDPNEIASPKIAEDIQATPFDYVPVNARAVVSTDRLDGLLMLTGALAPKLPPVSGLIAMQETWQADYGFNPFNAQKWSTWGIDSAAPAAVFNTLTGWVVVARLADPEVFPRWREAYANTMDFKVSEARGFEFTQVSAKTPKGRPLSIATTGKLVFVSVPQGDHSHAQFKTDVMGWVGLAEKDRFLNQHWVKDSQKRLKNKRMVAFLKPGEWMADDGGEGQAQVIWTRMKSQMGPVALSAEFDVMKREVALEFLSQSDRTEPSFVTSMGKARGKLPVMGGLIDPGVLSVVRVSASPENIYALVRSLMPPEDRTDLDAWIKEIQEVLNLDVTQDVLNNLSGHAVVVVYGFNGGVLAPDNTHLTADLFSLDATREAVLLPIESDERLRTVLDAVTTLSEGRLNRRTTGESVQYAWIEDGSLEWAIIVAKNYAIIIDSTAAFDHAVTYDRSARPLPKQLKAQGLDELFKDDRSAFYIDSGALTNLLNETGNKDAAKWLAPFRTVRAWTTEGPRGTSETSVILELQE